MFPPALRIKIAYFSWRLKITAVNQEYHQHYFLVIYNPDNPGNYYHKIRDQANCAILYCQVFPLNSGCINDRCIRSYHSPEFSYIHRIGRSRTYYTGIDADDEQQYIKKMDEMKMPKLPPNYWHQPIYPD